MTLDPELRTLRVTHGAAAAHATDLLIAGIRSPLVIVASVLSLGIFWMLGALLDVPHDGPFDVSLFHQPLAVATVLATAVGLLLTAALATLIAGRVRYDAGWGAAVFGLLGLRWRGGDAYYSVVGREPSVYFTLAAELATLALIAAAVWIPIHFLRERGSQSRGLKRILELPDPKSRLDDRKATRETLDQKVVALLCSTAVTMATVMLIARTDNETQVFFAVAAGGWLGATVAHGFVPTRPGPWFWAGPILAGVIGYAWAGMTTTPAQLGIGQPGGFLAPLARPLPLDWLAAGVPMALVGYVRSRTKQYQRVIEAQAR